MSDTKFVVLDTETTGLIEEGGRLAEIALLEVDRKTNGDFVIVDKYQQLLNPQVEFSEEASKVNGLTLDKCKDQPTFSEIQSEIDCWLNLKCVYIMYNAAFDRRILKNEYEILGKKMPFLDIVDVFFLAKKKIDRNDPRLETIIDRRSGLERKSMSQASVAQALGINTEGSHRAYQDTLILLEMYKKLLAMPDLTPREAFENSITVDKVIEANNFDNSTLTPDQRFDLTKYKATVVESVSGISIQTVVVTAIKSVRALLDKYNDEILFAGQFEVSNSESSTEAANLQVVLSKIKSEVVKARQESLFSIKKVTKAVEALFRETLVNRIDEASESIQSSRSTYIRKKYEKEKAEAEKKKLEAEKKAQEAGQKVFDNIKSISLDAALLDSLAEYERILASNKPKEPEKIIKSSIELGTVRDEIVYEVEVIDQKLVPISFCSPDLAKIQSFVNSMKGECQIPGVMITPRVKTRITSKRG